MGRTANRWGYRVIAAGLRGPEGPVALPDGSYAVVESMASRMTQISPDGELREIAHVGGGPNGMALGRDGRLLVANNGGIGHVVKAPGSLQQCDIEGSCCDLVTGLDAPNDVCVAQDGVVWFTDPRESWYVDRLPPGRVYSWEHEQLTVVHEGLDYPNGIGIDASGCLVIAESRSGQLVTLIDGLTEPWVQCPAGSPDGFCFDSDGRCFVCCFDAQRIWVIEPDGTLSDVLFTGPETMPTNCAIATDGSLIVTESAQGRLLAFDLGLRALRGAPR